MHGFVLEEATNCSSHTFNIVGLRRALIEIGRYYTMSQRQHGLHLHALIDMYHRPGNIKQALRELHFVIVESSSQKLRMGMLCVGHTVMVRSRS
jgi:hypothetical protein